MDGGRERGTGCATSCLDPLLPSHREALWGSWLSLDVPLSVTARQEKTSLYGIWRQQTELLSPCIIVYTLQASVLGFSVRYKDSLLSAFSLIPLCSFLRSWKSLSACYLQISLYVSLRWIQVSQSGCCYVTVQNHHKTDKKQTAKVIKNGKLIGSLESIL